MDGRADVRTVTSLSKILEWMDNLIFLPIALRYQSIKLLRLYLSLITLIKLPFNSIHNFANLSTCRVENFISLTIVLDTLAFDL